MTVFTACCLDGKEIEGNFPLEEYEDESTCDIVYGAVD